MAKGHENLIPIRDTETAKARGKLGGVKSGQVRRENKLLSEKLAEYFGEKDLTSHFEKIMARNDHVSVSLMKEYGELTEAKKTKQEFSTDPEKPITININAAKPIE
jgi:hypothetical protein